MNYLLDTHVWVWSLSDPHALTQAARDVIEDGEATMHLSPITYWELAMLAERGKLEFGGDVRRWIDYAHREYPVVDVPVTREIALMSRELEVITADPADRFIAASAVVAGCALVTRDARLLACEDIATIAA